MSPRSVAAVAAVLAAAGLGAVVLVGSTGGCDLAGCSTGVTVNISQIRGKVADAERVRVCALGRCVTTGVGSATATVPCPEVHDDQEIEVAADVRTKGDTIVFRDTARITLAELRPNGDGCDPVCFVGYAYLDPTQKTLEPRTGATLFDDGRHSD